MSFITYLPLSFSPSAWSSAACHRVALFVGTLPCHIWNSSPSQKARAVVGLSVLPDSPWSQPRTTCPVFGNSCFLCLSNFLIFHRRRHLVLVPLSRQDREDDFLRRSHSQQWGLQAFFRVMCKGTLRPREDFGDSEAWTSDSGRRVLGYRGQDLSGPLDSSG